MNSNSPEKAPSLMTENLALGLHDRGAIRFSKSGFTLKSGAISPIYIDMRGIPSFNTKHEMPVERQREVRSSVVTTYCEAIDAFGKEYEHLFGIPQAVTTVGGMVAYERGDSILWGRVGDKDYGTPKPIEGDYNDGDRVLCIDDVITSAASKIKAADDLIAQNLFPVGFAIMLDRESGGVEALQKHNDNYELIAIGGIRATLDILHEGRRIDDRMNHMVNLFLDDTAAFYKTVEETPGWGGGRGIFGDS